jgi:hypothetical protein
MMTNKYYTYIHYKADTLEPFYIGKGTKNRYKVKSNRSDYWDNVNNKHGFVSEILSIFKNEKDAFEHEKFLIATFKDLGYKLVNLTDGGEGSSGAIRSLKLNQQQSERFKDINFSKKCLSKLKEINSNPLTHPSLKGKIIATDLKTNKQYEFIGTKALLAFSFSYAAVYRCLRGERKTYKGYSFKRVEINNEYNVTQSTNTNN